MFYKNTYIRLFLFIGIIILLHKYAPTPLKYPNTNMNNNIRDNYHGNEVKDEYRWLEDETSAQTDAWIQKQNAFTDRYMRKIPFRKKIEKRLTELWNYPTMSMPFIKNNKIYFYKNNGLQNQSILYVKTNIDDSDSSAKVVLDPNKLSKDGSAIENAKMKIKIFMPEMPGMPYMEYKAKAKLINGEYKMMINFSMSGTWQYHLKFKTSDKKVHTVRGSFNI